MHPPTLMQSNTAPDPVSMAPISPPVSSLMESLEPSNANHHSDAIPSRSTSNHLQANHQSTAGPVPMASSPQDYIMDGHLKLEPGPVFGAKLAKKFINCGTLKTQASHKCTTTGNHIKCITAYGTGDKVLKFHCAVCDTSCKVASIKTHLGGEKHHKRWHVHLLPAATEAELTESYAVFCDLSGNRPYVSNRFHQAMSKKDPNYAAKRQRVSDGAVTVDATIMQPQITIWMPPHQCSLTTSKTTPLRMAIPPMCQLGDQTLPMGL